MLSVEKPGTPEKLVEHAGVKGMRWGVRKEARTAAGAASKTAYRQSRASGAGHFTSRRAGQKAGTAAAKAHVREARASSPLTFKQRFPTSAARTAEIHRARIQTQKDYMNALSGKNQAQREKLMKVYMNNPDRATAMRMTRGEKIVAGVLAGVLAVPTAGAVPAAVGGYTGTTLAIRKGIERGQRKRAGIERGQRKRAGS